MIKKFKKNVSGRDFVVGDIHGCFLLLEQKLEEIGFDSTAGDRLFSVGDLVDRGPNSESVLDWLDKPWFFAVRGNHEQMACDYYDNKIDAEYFSANGGGWFVRKSKAIQEMFVEYFRELPLLIEVETERGLVGIAHADCPSGSWDELKDNVSRQKYLNIKGGDSALFCEDLTSFSEVEQIIIDVIWSRRDINRYRSVHGELEYLKMKKIADLTVDHVESYLKLRQKMEKLKSRNIKGVHALVVGHTPVNDMLVLGNVFYIDTGAFFTGKFSILNLSGI